MSMVSMDKVAIYLQFWWLKGAYVSMVSIVPICAYDDYGNFIYGGYSSYSAYGDCS